MMEQPKRKPGRPKGSKNKKINLKEITGLQDAVRFIQAGFDKKEAYKAKHPNAADSTVDKNAYTIVYPEMWKAVKELIGEKVGATFNKEEILSLLTYPIYQYISGDKAVRTSDYLNAVKMIAELTIKNNQGSMSDLPKTAKEIDEELKSFGIDTSSLE